MNFDIQIGGYRLQMLESVTIKKSVESLSDTAVITIPGTTYNRALEIEDKISPGDRVQVRFGYDATGEDLPLEFLGYVETISTDNGSIRINCEDEMYNLRKDLQDKAFQNTTLKDILKHVFSEIGGFDFVCDYDLKYDKFVIHNATAFDVLKKLQEDTGANVYLKGTTLHLHPQYSELAGKVIYDFARNIEKSDLKYMDEKKRKFQVVVEGTDQKGKVVKVVKGTPGGDKLTFKRPGIADKESLEKIAEEQLKIRSYSGYEGNLTGWLIPEVEPTFQAEIRDQDYEYKTGTYYVISVETSFSERGGSRKVTIGKKIS
ncbi:MAG: hypothetical protein LUE98_07780 [Tannerellaceae bacterium]|nr:hypothetical protein [Tannerellaceae bacterium]